MEQTKKAKRKFINELIHNVKRELLSKVDYMPKEWDGIELREYIKYYFSTVVFERTLAGKRRREYNNTIIISGNL